MNRIYKMLKPTVIAFLSITASGLVMAQGAATAADAAAPKNHMPIHPNTALMVCAVILLFVIIWLYRTFQLATKAYKAKLKADAMKVMLVLTTLVFLGSEQPIMAQAPTAVATEAAPNWTLSGISNAEAISWILLAVVLAEAGIIFLFVKWIRRLTGLESIADECETDTVKSAEAKRTIWDRLNAFRPMNQEADLDVGHNYDGIRELDNITPPWFIAAFLASILFAAVYLVRYHVTESAPLMIEEYQISVDEAERKKAAFLAKQGDLVDENNVQMLGTADISAGSALYVKNCAVCHGNNGEGNVGPNMTDAYWIHGGSIKDVFKSIKYGWAEKGMKAWKDDFSASQIAQLSSYILSLQGTNPPNAKAAEGELWTGTAAGLSDSTAVDSASVAAVSDSSALN